MKNLAGEQEGYANPIVRRELEEAGIAIVPFEPGGGEVRATLGGIIEVGGYEILLDRRWSYWAAMVHRMPPQLEGRGPRLPRPLAVAMNDAPHLGARTHSGSTRGVFGDVVRADGYACGLASEDIAEDGVSCWHIDTQEGLNAFAQWCRAVLGRQP